MDQAGGVAILRGNGLIFRYRTTPGSGILPAGDGRLLRIMIMVAKESGTGHLVGWRVLAVALGFLVAATAAAEAGPVAGANSCGNYAKVAPSRLKCAKGSTVAMAQCLAALNAFRDSVACLINAERTSRGLPALKINKQLASAALQHTSDAVKIRWWVAGANPHVNPQTGSTPDSRIKAAGYCGGNPRRTSEIAYTWSGDQAAPVGAVNWWMNISKSGHREAILDGNVRELGVGYGGVVAASNIGSNPDMGTYVVDFGACN
jgi:uncharacterized protein YkwD